MDCTLIRPYMIKSCTHREAIQDDRQLCRRKMHYPAAICFLLSLSSFVHCANEYVYYEGVGYYYYSAGTNPWSYAQNDCIKDGAQLVVINSEEERQVVASIINKQIVGDQVYGGFSNSIDFPYFATTEGISINDTGYTHWATGKPSGQTSMCGAILRDTALLTEVPCGTLTHYICERKLWSDYEFYPDLGYYKFHTDGQKWVEAVETCKSEGAHLLVVDSKDEAQVVKSMFERYPTLPNADDVNHAYIGFRAVDDTMQANQTARTYLTIYGTSVFSLDYVQWEKGQPSPGNLAFCATIGRDTLAYNMNACTSNLAFFCEKEIVKS